MLNVILPFHSGDRDQALRLIAHIQNLGTREGNFYLMTQQHNIDQAMLPAGWKWIIDYLNVKSDWRTGVNDASGPNAMWAQTAREMCRLQKGPWLWLEPDAVPLRGDWLEALEAEYLRGGKPFMGGVAPKEGRMSGVAVYHQNTSRMCETALRSGKIAFDYAGAGDFLRWGVHFTPLIADHFRCDPFKDEADFYARVHREAVLHHGDKSGSIYQHIGGTRYEPQPEVIHMGERPAHSIKELMNSKPTGFAINSREAVAAQEAIARSAETFFEVEKIGTGDPIIFELHPPNPTNGMTEALNQKMQELYRDDQWPDGMLPRLDWIMEHIGEDRKKRALLYAELQKRGIEAGRPKRKKAAKQLAKK
jgi:hypothetical protein